MADNDIAATRIFRDLEVATNNQQIAELSKQYAALRPRNSPRDIEDQTGQPSIEKRIISKVLSIAETDPILAQTTLSEIAELASPASDNDFHHGGDLSMKAVAAWSDSASKVLDTKPQTGVVQLIAAKETFDYAETQTLRRVAAQVVLIHAESVGHAFKQAHDYVVSVKDFANADQNHFLQQESARVLDTLKPLNA